MPPMMVPMACGLFAPGPVAIASGTVPSDDRQYLGQDHAQGFSEKDRSAIRPVRAHLGDGSRDPHQETLALMRRAEVCFLNEAHRKYSFAN